jgi:Spy/CpxP family protein refolding chaperone
MRTVIVGTLCALSAAFVMGLGAAGLAVAAPARTVFHQEAEALLDQAATELWTLGAQLQQHLEAGRGFWGGVLGPGRGGPGMMGPGAPSPAERPLISIMLQHRADLGLTPEQVTRLEGLRDGFAREAIRRDADIRIAELDLGALLEQDPLDMTKVEAKVRELAQLQADLRVARLRTIEQGKALLTPDQKTRLQAVLGAGRPPRQSAGAGTRL